MEFDQVSIATLMENWRSVDLCARLSGAAQHVNERQFLPHLRGAIGQALAQWASQEALDKKVCSFDPPCAFDIFRNSQGTLGAGREIPKPFVLRADVDGQDAIVTLRLFGGACDWAPEFRAGLVAGLRREITLSNNQAQVFAVTGCWRNMETIEHIDPTRQPNLITVTPFIQRPRAGDDRIDAARVAAGLMDSILRRIEGLAWWHQKSLSDWINAQRRDLDAVQIAPDLKMVTMSRGQKSRKGWVGTLQFHNAPPQIRAVLAIALNCHIGTDTTHGAGRISVVVG